jgi:hypothetical protein
MIKTVIAAAALLATTAPYVTKRLRQIRVILLATMAIVLVAGCAHAADQLSVRCFYFNVATKQIFDGRCIVTLSANHEDFQVGDRTIRIVSGERQSQWERITFNNKPGMRFEQDRDTYHYTSSDLSEALDTFSPRVIPERR